MQEKKQWSNCLNTTYSNHIETNNGQDPFFNGKKVSRTIVENGTAAYAVTTVTANTKNKILILI